MPIRADVVIWPFAAGDQEAAKRLVNAGLGARGAAYGPDLIDHINSDRLLGRRAPEIFAS
jgi:hypothetical protein